MYYILSDGSYYVNYNGRWVRGGDYNNNNSGSNNTPTTGYEVLRNDPHYRYENGTHYYLKDNGDYYYYSNGKWVLVKASSTDSEAPTTSTVDSTSSASSEAAINRRFNFICKFRSGLNSLPQLHLQVQKWPQL
ncbi:MAG: hypothetical protein ACLTYH_08480 [Streptococcus salivarius]